MPIVVTPVPQSRFVSLTYNQIILGTTSAVVKGYWPLDERDDSTVVDLSTLNNDLSRPIDTPYITGQVNEGIRFTETYTDPVSGGVFDYGAGTFIDGGYGNWSIEAWVNCERIFSGTRTMLSVVSGSDTFSMQILRNVADGTPAGEVKPFGLQVNHSGVTGNVLDLAPMDTWHHIAVTCGNADGYKIYLNGSVVKTGSRLSAINNNFLTTTITIGSDAPGGATADYIIDEVALYDGIMSEDDVVAHYNAGLANQAPANPIDATWLLNETTGIIAVNDGNLGNGEYVNAPTLGVAGLTNSGTAVLFSGSPAPYIDTHFIAIDDTTFTMMIWVNSPTAPDTGRSFLMAGEFRSMSWSNASAQFRGAFNIKIGITWYSVSFGTLLANTTYHLTATYDGNELIAYKDGVLETSNATMTGSVTSDRGVTLKMMSAGDLTSPLSATVDEPRYYGRTLTGPEILAIYNDRV